MLARSKLSSIESKICETLINNEISHEDFITIINEEKKYRELKESTKKSRFIKNRSLGLKMLLSKFLLLGDILF